MENGSLANVLKRFGCFSESLTSIYISQVLDGLQYLHEQGVIHRDIKGANILTAKDGQVKLADFGVAMELSMIQSAGNSGFVMGTPYWMAPEIVEMSTPTTACDLWYLILYFSDKSLHYVWCIHNRSVGCTCIELLTESPPYFDLAPMPALYHIVQDEYPPLPDEISDTLRNFLTCCFAKEPSTRATASALCRHPWLRNLTDQLVSNTSESAISLVFEQDADTSEEVSDIPTEIEFPPRNKRSASMASFQNDSSSIHEPTMLNMLTPRVVTSTFSTVPDDNVDRVSVLSRSRSSSMKSQSRLTGTGITTTGSSEAGRPSVMLPNIDELKSSVEDAPLSLDVSLSLALDGAPTASTTCTDAISPLTMAPTPVGNDILNTIRHFRNRLLNPSLSDRSTADTSMRSITEDTQTVGGAKPIVAARPAGMMTVDDAVGSTKDDVTPISPAVTELMVAEGRSAIENNLYGDDTHHKTEVFEIGGRRTKEILNIMELLLLPDRGGFVRDVCEKLMHLFDVYPEQRILLFEQFGAVPLVNIIDARLFSCGQSSAAVQVSFPSPGDGDDCDKVFVLTVINRILEGNFTIIEQLALLGVVPGILNLLEHQERRQLVRADEVMEEAKSGPHSSGLPSQRKSIVGSMIRNIYTKSNPKQFLASRFSPTNAPDVGKSFSNNEGVSNNEGALPCFAFHFFASELSYELVKLVHTFTTSQFSLQMLTSAGGIPVLVKCLGLSGPLEKMQLYLAGKLDVDCEMLAWNIRARSILFMAIDCISRLFAESSRRKRDFCILLVKYEVVPNLAKALELVCRFPPNDHEEYSGFVRQIMNIFLHLSQSNDATDALISKSDTVVVFVSLLRSGMELEVTNSPDANYPYTPMLMELILEVIKCLSQDQNKLTHLQRHKTMDVLICLLKSNNVEFYKENILHTLHNLCRLNKARQEEAAELGIVPHLADIIMDRTSDLRSFALPIFFDLIVTSSTTRNILWDNDCVGLVVNLLCETYWQSNAIHSLSLWYVLNFLLLLAMCMNHLTMLCTCACTSKGLVWIITELR